MSALDAIDYEIEKLRQDIPKYQVRANKTAFRKSERDLHADRVVEWGEHRLAQLESARAALAELIEAAKELEDETFKCGCDKCIRLRSGIAAVSPK